MSTARKDTDKFELAKLGVADILSQPENAAIVARLLSEPERNEVQMALDVIATTIVETVLEEYGARDAE